MLRRKIIFVIAAALVALAAYAWHLAGDLVLHRSSPSPTGPVGAGVTALRCRGTNAFAVEHPGGVLLVDAGGGLVELAAALEEARIDRRRVTHVFLTHSDRDHAGGLALFAGGSVEVVMHGDEAAMVDGSTARLFGTFRNPPLPLRAARAWDGLTLSAGGRAVECLALPGHTTGHCGWLVDGKLLFSGDAVNLRDGRAHPFYRIYDRDRAAADASRARLAEFVRSRRPERMFTGHSGYSKAPLEAFVAP